ncbi:54S ribosomal protein L24, mitochondrial-like [Neltuma alba]|uniref:54S ribosomal protein L24, mitochondrial-like n=1 Tax=Neltuma alba TaxID=207710 RepID=UPI0010A43901|nr:54S ribosomal protein L24, mitochondrial-like [Prosopis alba]
MAFRGKEMMKKVLKKVGEHNLAPGVKESLEKCMPKSKVVMGRAKRGIYAGRHIQFGNRVSEDGGNKTRRTWKPNVQEKRLFSYILDRHIRVKVTTHALRCIDKAGGVDEYFLKTPYHKLDTELGLFWKAKIEKLYEELGKMEVVFFSPEDEQKFEQGFKELKLSEREARREFRRKMYTGMNRHKQSELESKDEQSTDMGGSGIEERISRESEERLAAVSYGLAADNLEAGNLVANY